MEHLAAGGPALLSWAVRLTAGEALELDWVLAITRHGSTPACCNVLYCSVGMVAHSTTH